MNDKIPISDETREAMTSELASVGLELSRVADGAYVTGSMFFESHSQAGDRLNELLGVLSDSASALMEIDHQIAAYVATIISDFGVSGSTS